MANEDDERFGFGTFFYGENTFHGVHISGIAANPPNGIGGVKDDTALPDYLSSLLCFVPDMF